MVNGILGLLRMRIVHRDWGPRGHHSALQQMIDRGFVPDLVVDVGAAKGTWTEEFLDVFPRVGFFLVDPLLQNQPLLSALAERHGRVRYWIGVAGAVHGEVEIVSSGDQSSLYKESEFAGEMVEVPMCRLDELISKYEGKPHNILMKIDVQGAELQVLEGAKGMLDRLAGIIVEVTILPIYRDAPLASEVISWLHDNGFRIFDICSYAQRPKDGRLSQMDVLFVPKGSPYFGEPGWM